MRRVLFLFLLVIPGLAMADFHFQNRADVLDAKESKLAGEITAFLKAYEIAYNKTVK